MTYRSLVTEGGKLLQAAGVAEAELDAWYLWISCTDFQADIHHIVVLYIM